MAKTYLDRSEVLKKIGYVARSWCILESARKALAEKIKAIPAADVEPVKHGKWDDSSDGITPCCTICGKTHSCMKRTPPFCPNCGARMDGDKI